MAKTLPQLVKIDRVDPDRVEAHNEPYAWQKPANPLTPDPLEVPTVRLPRPGDGGPAKFKPR